MEGLQSEFENAALIADDLTLLQMLRAFPGQLDPSVNGSQTPLVVACHSGNLKLFKKLMAYPTVTPILGTVKMALDHHRDEILMRLLKDPRTPLEPFETATWSFNLAWQLWGLPISVLRACSSGDTAALATHDLSRIRYKQMDLLMTRSTGHPAIIKMLKLAQLSMFGIPAQEWSIHFISSLPFEMPTCKVRAMFLARRDANIAVPPSFPSVLSNEIALLQKPKVHRLPPMVPPASLAIRTSIFYKGLELAHNVQPIIGTASYLPSLILAYYLVEYFFTTHVHQVAMKSEPFSLICADIGIIFYFIVCTLSIFKKGAYEAIMVPVALAGIMITFVFFLKRFNRD